MALTEPAATSTAVAILCERVMRRVEMRGMRELFLWGTGFAAFAPRRPQPVRTGRVRRWAIAEGSYSVLAGIHG
ncbi:hypothetical protein ACZ90_41475 [Streptomyces albus subsp. albus]|nr:hypothetical protein ACZ90_41475 [Streptomyces albus subsp. albus]